MNSSQNMSSRTTITDITTTDQVYIQFEDFEGFSIAPTEAIVLGREIIGLAVSLLAPQLEVETEIRLNVEIPVS